MIQKSLVSQATQRVLPPLLPPLIPYSWWVLTTEEHLQLIEHSSRMTLVLHFILLFMLLSVTA